MLRAGLVAGTASSLAVAAGVATDPTPAALLDDDFEAPGESVTLPVEVFSSDTTGTRDPTEEPGSFPYSVDHDYDRVTPQ